MSSKSVTLASVESSTLWDKESYMALIFVPST